MDLQAKLDCDLLLEFIDRFYGYGSYKAKYWFIGKEEGGGGINTRLEAWSRLGRHELEDVANFHNTMNIIDGKGDKHRHFTENPASQSTWNRLIRIVLTAESGIPPTLGAVKECQQKKLASREYHHTCLLELLPLPSRSTNEWIDEYLECVGSRLDFTNAVAPKRTHYLRQMVTEHRPKVVVFYSTDYQYRQRWQEIAGVEFIPHKFNNIDYYSSTNSGTKFFVVMHPTYYRKGLKLTHAYFHHIGQLIGS